MDPIAEYIERHGVGQEHNVCYICMGIGRGAHLEKLRAAMPDDCSLLAFEYFKPKANTLMERRVYTDKAADIAGALANIQKEIAPDKFKIVDYPWRETQEGATFYGDAITKLSELIGMYASDTLTHRKLDKTFLTNALKNLSLLKTCGIVAQMEGVYSGAPAVLIAAGPSLDDHMDELRRIQDRAVIITASTALKKLLSAGVEPDFVGHMDPHSQSVCYLDTDVPEKTVLVFDIEGCPDAPLVYRGKTILADTGRPVAAWVRSYLKMGRIQKQSSVAHFDLSLAQFLGCNSYYLVGHDFSFTADAHCAGCNDVYGDRGWFEHKRKNNKLVQTQGRSGLVWSTDELLGMRSLLERQIKDQHVKPVLVGDKGVAISGSVSVPDLTALNKLRTITKQHADYAHPAIDAETLTQHKRRLVNRFDKLKDRLKHMHKESGKALKNAGDIIQSYIRTTKAWQQMSAEYRLEMGFLQMNTHDQGRQILQSKYITDNKVRCRRGYELLRKTSARMINTLHDVTGWLRKEND